MSQFLLGVGFGLVTASIVAIAAVALSLQYSVTRFPNFAHGELMIVGAYGAYQADRLTHNVVVEIITACIMGGALASAMNLLLFRPFQRRGSKLIILFVLSIAVSLIVQAILEWIYGGSSVTFSTSAGKPYHIGPFVLTRQELAIMGAAVLAMILVHVVLRYTKFGKAQRAVADSLNLAAVTGISVNAVIQTTWLLAGILAGFAGYVLALNVGSFTPTTGFSFLLVIFAAAVLGRIGSIYGAMLGALVIGIATEVSALYIPADYKNSVAFGLLILTLLVRPAGLFTRRAVTA